jgi:hypothetical protein
MMRIFEIKEGENKTFDTDGEFQVINYKGRVFVIGENGCSEADWAHERLHVHDCTECIFLFSIEGDTFTKGKGYPRYDVYYCQRDETFLYRRDDEGSHYTSGPDITLLIRGIDYISLAKTIIKQNI